MGNFPAGWHKTALRSPKSLSTLFVLISCFFIAICSMIINDRNRVEAGFRNSASELVNDSEAFWKPYKYFDWLKVLVVAYCKSIIIILTVMSVFFLCSITLAMVIYIKAGFALYWHDSCFVIRPTLGWILIRTANLFQATSTSRGRARYCYRLCIAFCLDEVSNKN